MHWILQENLFKEQEWTTLIDTLDRFKIPHSEHKVVPFVGELIPEAGYIPGNIICFGSYSMRHVAKKSGWVPGVFDLEAQNFNVQMEHWGDMMLNADSQVVAFKDAVVVEDTFIRPIDDSKFFAGRVFDAAEFNDWQHKVCILKEDFGNSLSGGTLIQLSKPKKILAEYRFWIVDKKIATQSLYKLGNSIVYSSSVDDHVVGFVARVLDHGPGSILADCTVRGWQPARAFVLDVCETPDGMRIVEINTINAAGFYAGNMTDLILSLEAMRF